MHKIIEFLKYWYNKHHLIIEAVILMMSGGVFMVVLFKIDTYISDLFTIRKGIPALILFTLWLLWFVREDIVRDYHEFKERNK